MDAYCGARRDISRDELELRCCATGRVIHGTDTIGKVCATCALFPLSSVRSTRSIWTGGAL
jgi:hypothetical protein